MRKLIKGQKYVCVRSEQTELVRQKLYECESHTESGYVRMVGERSVFSESRFEPINGRTFYIDGHAICKKTSKSEFYLDTDKLVDGVVYKIKSIDLEQDQIVLHGFDDIEYPLFLFEPFLHEDTPPEQESVIMVVPGYGYGNLSLDAVRKVVSKLEGKKGKFVRWKGSDHTSTHWVFEEDKVTNNIFHVGDLIDDGSTGKGVIYGKTKDEIYVRFFNGEDHKFDTNAETTFIHR